MGSVALAALDLAGKPALDVRTFRVEDGISRPFVVRVVALSTEQIDHAAVVARPARFHVDSGVAHVQGASRTWTGVCHRFEQSRAEPTGLSTYEIEIRPSLSLLAQQRGYRIYQHLSIPSIVEAVLSESGVEPTWEIDRSRYPKLEYRVQYGETDHDFVCRLLEEAGIAWIHSDAEGGESRLVLSDKLERGARRAQTLPWTENPNQAAEQEFASEVRISLAVRPGARLLVDSDFRRPSYDLKGQADPAIAPEGLYEQYEYRPGAFVVEMPDAPSDTPVADERGIARYSERYGQALAQRELDAMRADRRVVSYRTNTLDLRPGSVFGVDGHPHPAIAGGQSLLATDQTLEGDVNGEWTTRGSARPASTPHRPEKKTKKPVVDGVQSATVVGPSGQEISTDEFGRVRVQFPWDSDGKSDDKSSAWLRVSQSWAGGSFGVIHLPRVGQEVLVGFLDGNPDQPIVVGRVFNQTQPVPYTLPDHQTRSTWKSQSSPGGDGYNEIMFEDLAGAELFWERAERDLRRLVKNDETITVERDRQKLVKGSETEISGGNRVEVTGQSRTEITRADRTSVVHGTRRDLVKEDSIERVERDSVEYVGVDKHVMTLGVHRELVGGDRHMKVLGDRNEQVGGTYGLSAASHQIACGSQAVGAGTIHLKAASMIVIEAPDVTLKAGGGFIRINGSGVTITGSQVLINSGGSPGVLLTGGGGNPEPPKEAEVDDPPTPVVDDVSVTGLGPGR